MAQFFGEERSEFYAPFAEGFVTDLDAALVEQFLNVPVAQRKAMIEPDGVLDGDHGETVAVWFGVGHGQSDYPDPIKATQPRIKLSGTLFFWVHTPSWGQKHVPDSLFQNCKMSGNTTAVRSAGRL